jgi:hypothetical protein
MKKTLVLLMILISLSYCSCNRCANIDNPTDPRISSCFFKVGSYFIYSDTTDHIIDSQYIFFYSYLPNFFSSRSDECTSYTSSYNMQLISYRNGLYYDSISVYSREQDYLCWSQTEGGISGNCFDPQYATLINNFAVGGNVYPTVYEDPACELISSDTIDLYFVPGYSIVKRVEHRPTGDVNWDLIRYHILQ